MKCLLKIGTDTPEKIATSISEYRNKFNLLLCVTNGKPFKALFPMLTADLIFKTVTRFLKVSSKMLELNDKNLELRWLQVKLFLTTAAAYVSPPFTNSLEILSDLPLHQRSPQELSQVNPNKWSILSQKIFILLEKYLGAISPITKRRVENKTGWMCCCPSSDVHGTASHLGRPISKTSYIPLCSLF